MIYEAWLLKKNDSIANNFFFRPEISLYNFINLIVWILLM
jgi:hypothetical protein